MGTTIRQVSLPVHRETKLSVVTNQLRSTRIEERRGPRSAGKTKTVRALIETTAGSRSLVARTIGTAIAADYLTPAAPSLPLGSKSGCLARTGC
jgi:hypothetical protein